jgi:hypothetical protein
MRRLARAVVTFVFFATTSVVGGCALFYPLHEKVGLDAGTSADAGEGGLVANDGWGCSSDQQCSDRNGDLPFTCRPSDHTCQPLETAECRVVHPRTWLDPHAVFLGSYTVLPEADSENSDLVWDYELAVDEFNDHGGLPDTQGILHTLVMVICNSDPAKAASDPEFLVRSLDHLTDVVGVASIVADLPSKDLISAYERTKSRGKDVLFLSPGPADNDLAHLDDNGRVWSMLGLPIDLAPAYKALLERTEKYIRAQDPDVQALRVALVKSGDINEPRHEQLSELLDALTATSDGEPHPNSLEFNGQDLAANAAAQNYRELTLNASDGSAATVAHDILDFAPHVVISMAGPPVTHFDTDPSLDGVIDTVESNSTDRRYPFFILSPVNASAWVDVATTIQSIAQRYPDIHRRFLGIDVATADDPTLYYQYLDRLRSPPAHRLAKEHTENYYDPVYYLTYAMYRTGVDRSLTGEHVLAGLLSTFAGARYDVGPDPIPTVFSALAPQEPALSIELVGTMGEPSFDHLTGTRVNRAALYCFPEPPSFDVHQQVQVYVGGTWQGNFDCFSGF